MIVPALKGQPVAYFSPTYRMLTEVWREADRVLRPVARRIVRDEHRIELVTGGVVEMWSLDNPHVARGRKYARVILDEAAHVKDLDVAWQEVIRPTLADYQGDAWFLSTPNGFDFFHELFSRGGDPRYPDYAAWQMPTTANPHIDAAEIETIRQETPERIFSQEYLAAFVDEATSIFRRAWWEGHNRYDATDAVLERKALARWLSYDTAAKDGNTNAYTACVVGELWPDYRLAIRQVWRERLRFPELASRVALDVARWNDGRLRGVLIEDRSSGIGLSQTLESSLPANLASLLVPFDPKGAKALRAEQASVWAANDMIVLPHPSEAVPWLLDYEDELYAAPLGQYMDQVDATVQLVLYLENYLSEGVRARGGGAAA